MDEKTKFVLTIAKELTVAALDHGGALSADPKARAEAVKLIFDALTKDVTAKANLVEYGTEKPSA